MINKFLILLSLLFLTSCEIVDEYKSEINYYENEISDLQYENDNLSETIDKLSQQKEYILITADELKKQIELVSDDCKKDSLLEKIDLIINLCVQE